jgi:hypothetical protein
MTTSTARLLLLLMLAITPLMADPSCSVHDNIDPDEGLELFASVGE